MRRLGVAPTGAKRAVSDGIGTSATACSRPTPDRLMGRVKYQDQSPVVGLYIGPSTATAPGRRDALASGTNASGWFLGLGRAAAQSVPSGCMSKRSRNENVSKLNARSNR